MKVLIKKTGKNFQEIYDFHRLWRVKEANLRIEKFPASLETRKKKNIKKFY